MAKRCADVRGVVAERLADRCRRGRAPRKDLILADAAPPVAFAITSPVTACVAFTDTP